MSWRFRKSLSLGMTRLTLSRRGLGTSFRFPGFRIGRSADGRWYVSFGLAGTGFYWIKYF